MPVPWVIKTSRDHRRRCGLYDAAAAAPSGPDWWDPDSESLSTIAAYQPKGAASLAASYVNLANPGTYDAAPGVAPSWAAGTGWTYNGTTQYLTTNIYPTPPGWSMLVQYSGFAAPSASKFLLGVYDTLAPAGYFLVGAVTGNNMRAYSSGTTSQLVTNSPHLTAGNYAVAGLVAYRNGAPETPAITNSTANTPNNPMPLGCGRYNGGNSWYAAHTCIAAAIYDVVLTAAQVSAITTAMAAL